MILFISYTLVDKWIDNPKKNNRTNITWLQPDLFSSLSKRVIIYTQPQIKEACRKVETKPSENGSQFEVMPF